MFTGGILECVLGNTFSFIVFASYGELLVLKNDRACSTEN